MTKADLTTAIAREAGTSLRDAGQVLELILSGMSRALRRGERVEIRRFGSLFTYVRPGRKTMLPRTGEWMEVGAKRVVAFRASSMLLRTLEDSGEDTVRRTEQEEA